MLTRIVRFKPHTLSDKEEKLLAMQTEMAGALTRIFRQLNDTDMKFGAVKNGKGEQIELSHATYTALLYCPDRQVRAEAFATYYRQYAAHQHTLAETLNSSMQRDVYYAKARNYASSLEAALFPDVVPIAVYDNLLASIHRQLPALHEYYDVRRRKMGLSDLHFYDTYAPIVADVRMHHTWDEAVEVVLAALAPLGSEYCDTIRQGFTRQRWCDRYENRGKQSGARFPPARSTASRTSSSTSRRIRSIRSSPWPTRAATRCTAITPARRSLTPTTTILFSSPRSPASSTRPC